MTLVARLIALEHNRRLSGAALLEVPLNAEQLAHVALLWELSADETRVKRAADAADIVRCRAFLHLPRGKWTSNLVATIAAWWNIWPDFTETGIAWLEENGVHVERQVRILRK